MRRAGASLGCEELRGGVLDTTLQPCGCARWLSIWAKIGRIVYGAGRDDVHEMYLEAGTSIPIDFIGILRQIFPSKGGLLEFSGRRTWHGWPRSRAPNSEINVTLNCDLAGTPVIAVEANPSILTSADACLSSEARNCAGSIRRCKRDAHAQPSHQQGKQYHITRRPAAPPDRTLHPPAAPDRRSSDPTLASASPEAPTTLAAAPVSAPAPTDPATAP